MKKIILFLAVLILVIEISTRVFYKGPRLRDPLSPQPMTRERLNVLRSIADQKTQSGEFVILVTGGSVAYGWGASDEEKRFPKQLETELRKKYPAKKIRVINAGVPGFEALDELTFYIHFLRKLKPNMIVMMTGYNDLLRSTAFQMIPGGEDRLDRIARYNVLPTSESGPLLRALLGSIQVTVSQRLREISAAFRFLDDKRHALNYRPLKNLSAVDFNVAERELPMFLKSIQAFHFLAKTESVPFFCVIQPMGPLAHIEDTLHPLSKFSMKLRRLYRERWQSPLQLLKTKDHIPLFDLNDQSVDGYVKEGLFIDVCHFNDAGNLKLAQDTMSILEQHHPF